MEVFKNTSSSNKILWRVKHLIEIRPVRFLDGEPTDEDLKYTRVDASGECRIVRKLEIDSDPSEKRPEDFDVGYLLSQNMRKWSQAKQINEDEVWTDPERSRC